MSQTNASNLRVAYLTAAEELRSNRDQRSVYESRGNCVVLAGPGSGKTKTLTIKLARMLAEDVRSPRGIACITYNNECARELERRLDKLGVRRSPYVFIGTIHSFCLVNVLKPYARMAGLGLSEPLMVASGSDQRESFECARASVFGQSGRTSRTEMDVYRRKYLDRKATSSLVDSDPVFNLIEAYEEDLRSRGLIDFDDMMILGHQLITQHEWIRKLLKARFPILVVDEYQDLGLALHEIVSKLCFDTGVRLLAVGDPDQSIYGFTGASPELLSELAERAEVEQITLKMNYRCGKIIARASEMLLQRGNGVFDTPDGALEGTIDFHAFPRGIQEQAQQICTQLIPDALTRQPDRSLGDIAILYVDKNDGDTISQAAKDAGLNFIRIDQNAPYPRTPLTRWLEDCAAWCVGGWKTGEPRLSNIIQTWMMLNGVYDSSDRQTIDFKKQLVRFLWNRRNTSVTLKTWLGDFESECLGATFNDSCEQKDEYEALLKLKCACEANGQMEDFTVPVFAGQGGSPTHLNLITLHSAKGREFEVVIMMGLEQGRIPWTNDDAAKKGEKRRLFYVGVTRAKHEVHMTYSGWYHDNKGSKKNGPSEYVLGLQNYLNA